MLEMLVDATRHEVYVEHETLKATVMKVRESGLVIAGHRHRCNL